MGLPLAPFVPISRGFFQPYRQSTNASYRYSPMSAYCHDTSLLQQQQQISGMLTPTGNSLSLSNSLNCGVSSAPASIVLPILPQATQPQQQQPASQQQSQAGKKLIFKNNKIFNLNFRKIYFNRLKLNNITSNKYV